MLDVLRRGASTWISKVLLGLLIVSFGIWGIADVFRGFGSNTAYKVGSHEIGVVTLDQEYQRELQQFARRIGRPFTKDEALKTGVSQQILSRIVTETLIGEIARDMSLGISDDGIRAQIFADPAFKGADGTFDRNRFVDLLRANGWNEDIYVVQRRADALRQQLVEGVSGGMTTPKVWLEALDQFRNESRTVRYVTLTAASLGDIPAPADTELGPFYEARKAAFRAPETRSVTALVLDAAAVSKPADVTDDDAKAEWASRKDKYTTPEKRRVLQMTFDDTAAAEAAEKAIAGGKSFEDVAAERGLKAADIDLGLLTRGTFLDPKIAEAAFALADVGAVSPPVAGRFKIAVLKLAERVPATETPFAEVAAGIKKEIADRRAEGDVLSLHDQIEDALAGGADIASVAKRFGLTPLVIDGLTKDGRLVSGADMPAVPQRDRLLNDAFESDVGVENDPIDLGGHGFMWFAVTKVTPAHDQTLEAVRDRVLAAWKAETVSARLGETAKSLIEKLGKGEDFDKVAAEAGLTPTTSPAFKRADRPEGLTPAAIAAAFKGGNGFVGEAAGADEARIVLQVASIDDPVFFAETDTMKALATDTATALQNTLLESWLTRVQADIGVTSNPTVVARVTGRPVE